MLEVKADTQLILEENIILQAIPELEHYYVFNTKDGDHFELNHTAHWVLEKIGNGIGFAELSNEFANIFELNNKQANQDLSEVINFAIKNNILKEVLL